MVRKRIRLGISLIIISLKGIFFGFGLLVRMLCFMITTNFRKGRALGIYEKKLLNMGLPRQAAKELRGAYDFKWKEIIKFGRQKIG